MSISWRSVALPTRTARGGAAIIDGVRLPADKRVVRVSSLGVVVSSATLPLAMQVPTPLPAIATGSVLLLYVERAVAIFVALVLVLVFLYRGWHGQLPRSVSEKGAEWEELAAPTADGAVQEQVEALSRRVDALQHDVERSRREPPTM
jgi:hypothetical protein